MATIRFAAIGAMMKQTGNRWREFETPRDGDLSGLLMLLDTPLAPSAFDDGLHRLARSVAVLQRVRTKAA